MLAGKSPEERDAYLHGTSYTDFLRQQFGLPDEAIQIFSNAPSGFWGVPAEHLSVAEGLWSGLPGAHVVGGWDEPGLEENDHDVAMFPDGNSSIARLLVRCADPGILPGHGRGRRPVRRRDRTARLRRARSSRVARAAATELDGRPCRKCRGRYGRHRRLRERRAGAASLRAPGRARLLQRHHSPPRARTPGDAKDGPRAVREAADAGGQHGAAQRPGAAETRHQGRPAPRKLPAERVPGDRRQRRRLSPGWRPEDACVHAVLRQLRGTAARARASRTRRGPRGRRCSPCRSRTTSAKCARC